MALREVVIVGAGCSGACTVREICAQLRRKIEAMDEEKRPEESKTSTSPYELLVTVVDKGGPRLQHKHDEAIYSSSSSDDDALNKLLNHLHTIKKEEDIGGEEEDETREKEKKPSFMSYENHLIQTFWKGVAYGAKDDHHLLNVPTAFMSAVHGAEGDFKNWLLEACSPDQALNSPATELFYPEIDSRWIKFSENGHCCRRIFGQYLTHRTNCEIIRLFQTLKKRNSIASTSNKKTRKDINFTLRLVAAEALNVKDGNGGGKEKSSLVIKKMTTTTTQQRDDGHKDRDKDTTTTVPFDDLVLAHGNLPPKVMKSLEPLVTNSSGVTSSFIGNPWKFPAVDLISSTSSSSSSTLIPTAATTTPPPPFRIAIIGTRLTAIDFALHLYHQPNGLKDLSDIQKQQESGGMDDEMRKKVELVFLSREGLFPFPNPGEEQLPSVDSTCLLVPEAIPILEKEHKRRVLLKEQQEEREREAAVEEGEKMKEQQVVRLRYLLQEPADSFLDFELFFNEIQRVLASLSLETLLCRLEQCLRDPQQQENQSPSSSVVQWEQRLDSLRPWTSLLWMSRSGADRSTLLRKYRGVFEVRRHRVSPQIYSFMTSVLKLKLPASSSETQESVGTTKYYHQLKDEDTSTFSAVSVRAEVIGSRFITPPDETCADNSISSHHKIGIQLRSTSGQDGGEEREEIFDLVVNCTGPNADYRTTEHPLIASLRDSQLIDPDENAIALRLQPHRSKMGDEKEVSSSNKSTATILPGLVATPKTAEESSTIHFSGGKCPIPPRIFAVGPPRRGSEWETIAVKEIRQQAYVIAGQIV